MNGTNNTQTADLLVIPQAGRIIPAPHLTPDDAEQAQHAWAHPDAPSPRTWIVDILHIRDGAPRITARVTIPHSPTAVAA